MLRFLLRQVGIGIEYRSNFGTHLYRYGVLDRITMRPIHREMSVAPPWATRHFVRIKD
jgi:hypothetical protein